MMSILEDIDEFQWFWAVLEERKKKGKVLNTQENFQKLADWTSREYLGLLAILQEELEEVDFMKILADLKSLNFIYGLVQK